MYPPAAGVVDADGFANGVQVYPTGAQVPLEFVVMITFGLVQLMVKPFVVVGVTVNVGTIVLDTMAIV